MFKLNRENLPHYFYYSKKLIFSKWFTFWAGISASWWYIKIGSSCRFLGRPHFYRYPESRIEIGPNCRFNSLPTSNLLGINRPCIISSLKPEAIIKIGENCGFSGTTIGCALNITLGNNVRCGANTTITDTDWHFDDERSGLDAPVNIGNNVWLGANVIVLKGVTIGENTIVGAGSIVSRSLPSDVVAVGSPAKVVKELH
mgnify:CR=1 FL=1